LPALIDAISTASFLARHGRFDLSMNLGTIEDIYPLSPMQQGMLYHSVAAPESAVYFEQTAWAFHGSFHPAAFQRAWQRVVDRHAVLRTDFDWEELDEPVQVVHRELHVPLEQLDWSRANAEQKRRRMEAFLKQDRSRGFDPASVPLMRLAVIRMAEDEHHFVWSIHHLLMDGWSTPLLLKEVFALYQAFCRGEDLDLSSPRPYRDYIAWLQRQDRTAAERFWRTALQGLTAPTVLHADRTLKSSREPGDSHGEERVWLSADATDPLRSFARQNRLTLNTLLQGAFAILLSRYCGERDVLFGATVSGRPAQLDGAEEMIGLFINTLPVRVQVDEDEPVLPWLRNIQQRQAERSQFEYASLMDIHRWSELPRGRSIFDAILVVENYPRVNVPSGSRDTVRVRGVHAFERTNYPLTLVAGALGELSLRAVYDPLRFQAATIQRMLGHLQTLLQGLVADPARRLSELPLMTEAERHQVLVQWNQTGTDYPREATVHSLFEDQTARKPDAIAVVCPSAFPAQAGDAESSQGADVQLTYAELNARANQVARALKRCGVGPEVMVGLCAERGPEMLAGMLGILKAGGAYVPLEPTYPAQRLAFMIEDTNAPVLLTQRHLLKELPAEGRHVIFLDADEPLFEEESRENIGSGADAESLAYVIYTSGSTGRPKGTMVPHRGVVRLVKATNYIDPGPDEVFLQFAAISFDASTFEIWGPLLNGGRLVVFPPHTPSLEELGSFVEEQGITVLWLTAALFRQMVDQQLDRLKGVRQLLAGGETLSAPHVRKVLQTLGDRCLVNGYGPTENTTFTCCHRMDAASRVDESVPIGRPIANTEVYVLDKYGAPVPIGVPGELYTGGDGLARGYLNLPELTAEHFVPHPFRPELGAKLYCTGDQVRWLPDGAIEFLGRVDHQVKIRGFRVELGEIEAALREHPSVSDAVVLAREDAPGDKRLVAYVVFAAGRPADTSRLQDFLTQKLPRYMVPSALLVMDSLPLTPNKKLDRSALPAPGPTRPDLEAGFVAPRTPVEKTLAAIWTEILRIDRVGIHDNFFQLGGDSILSIQIVARANDAEVKITPKQMFERQTIAELAAVAGTVSTPEATQGWVTGPVPLTPVQHWFFQRQLPNPHHFNQAVLQEVHQAVDAALLEQTVRQLSQHHDALRLRFSRSDAGWQQVNLGPGQSAGFTEVDLSNVPEADQGRAIEEKAAELQAGLNLSDGPLMRVALFHLGPQHAPRLLVTIHHLAVDVVSFRILLEDLQTVYQQLSRGETPRLPSKTTSFQYWARRLQEHAQSATLTTERDYWLAQSPQTVSRLPVDIPEGRGANTVASAQRVLVSLNTEETKTLLQEVPKAYHTQINDVLLTAVVRAFAPWTSSTSLLIDLEGHGREHLFDDVNLSRTVGWFTTIFPVCLDLEGCAAPGDALRRVKEQLRRVPNRGIGYGLLRYLGDDADTARKMRALPRAGVCFNYVGQLDQVLGESGLFRPARESSGPARDRESPRSHLVAISGHVVGGELQMVWEYSANLHHRATIEGVARQFITDLRRLITHCQSPEAGGHTPSDFALAGLDEDELGKLADLIDGADRSEDAGK